jgi:hypothetical protein
MPHDFDPGQSLGHLLRLLCLLLFLLLCLLLCLLQGSQRTDRDQTNLNTHTNTTSDERLCMHLTRRGTSVSAEEPIKKFLCTSFGMCLNM